jgi:glutathione S-transferase
MTRHDTLRLYDYAGSCNCYKVRLLLAQLELPYERIPVDIFDGETLTDDYAQINPMRMTPVLATTHGYLPESNAILLYLAAGTPLLPDEPFELAQVMRWLIFEQTDVIPTIAGLRFRLLVGRLSADSPEAKRRAQGARDALRLLDEHLAARDFFVGGCYTIADIALYGYTHRAHEAGIDLGPYANVRAWFARVEQQPGYIEDVEPYGANAAAGAGRSIYDSPL